VTSITSSAGEVDKSILPIVAFCTSVHNAPQAQRNRIFLLHNSGGSSPTQARVAMSDSEKVDLSL